MGTEKGSEFRKLPTSPVKMGGNMGLLRLQACSGSSCGVPVLAEFCRVLSDLSFRWALGDQWAVGGWIRSMKGYSANRRHFVGLRSCGVLEDAGFGSFSYAACDECLRTLVSRIVFPGLVQPAWSCI